MFHVDRWAVIFTDLLGENAEAGLDCLKALIPPIKTIPGALFGYSASRQLEKILRESISSIGGASSYGGASYGGGVPENTPMEYAIRFITLVVEKNHFGDIDSIVYKIEDRINTHKGILVVTVESASPVDGNFAEELRQHIIEKTRSAQVAMKIRQVPELLGGYRLRIGGYYVDASLKGQTEKMKAALEKAVLATAYQGEGI